MGVEVECGLFFVIEDELVGEGGGDLLADEDVGEGLVAVEDEAVVGEGGVLEGFAGEHGGKLEIGEDVLGAGLLLGVQEDASVLEKFDHPTDSFIASYITISGRQLIINSTPTAVSPLQSYNRSYVQSSSEERRKLAPSLRQTDY